MIVLDASAFVEQLLDTPKGERLQERCLSGLDSLHCPHLLDLEVIQVVRRYSQQGWISAQRAFQAMEDLADFPFTRYAHAPFLFRIWELRENLTAYDAAYVALAEVLDVTLVTCDSRLTAASGHSATIEVF